MATEPWAILRRHPQVPEVGEHSATPCLVSGDRNVVSGHEPAVQGADTPVLLRFTASPNCRCGEADRGAHDSKQSFSYDRVIASRNRRNGTGPNGRGAGVISLSGHDAIHPARGWSTQTPEHAPSRRN